MTCHPRYDYGTKCHARYKNGMTCHSRNKNGKMKKWIKKQYSKTAIH